MVERDGTRVRGVRKGCDGQGNMMLLNRVNRVLCSSLQLIQTQSPEHTTQLHDHSGSEQHRMLEMNS